MNNIVSGLYAVYIAYNVLYYILQRSAGWNQLVMFSCRKSHVAYKAVFGHDRKKLLS